MSPDRSTAKTISDVRRTQTPHWECFQTSDASASVSASASALASTSTSSHRTRTPATTTQRKRKRKNSDTEYTPHQKAETNQYTAPTVRRSSKRLAVSARPEQRPTSTTTNTLSSRSTSTERSSSSTSALTSASFTSFDRLPTPKDLDTSDSPVSTSKSEPRSTSPHLAGSAMRGLWIPPSDESDTSSEPEPEPITTTKIGPPQRVDSVRSLNSLNRSRVGDRLLICNPSYD